MLKFLYLDGTVLKRKFGVSLRKMKVNGARPLVIEYDEVDWAEVEEKYLDKELLLADYWHHNMMECVDAKIRFPMPLKLKELIHRPKPKPVSNPFLESKEKKLDNLIMFWKCDCGLKVLSGAICKCGKTGMSLKTISPTVVSAKAEVSKSYLDAVANKSTDTAPTEDRSMECVGCQ